MLLFFSFPLNISLFYNWRRFIYYNWTILNWVFPWTNKFEDNLKQNISFYYYYTAITKMFLAPVFAPSQCFWWQWYKKYLAVLNCRQPIWDNWKWIVRERDFTICLRYNNIVHWKAAMQSHLFLLLLDKITISFYYRILNCHFLCTVHIVEKYFLGFVFGWWR